MSPIEIVWKDACELPLRDAAFQLWRYKDKFDDAECGARKFIHFDDPTEEARHMQAIMDNIRHDHDFAHEGPTFDRLKRAHPNASDADIRDAIRAAVKMMDACSAYFDANYRDFGNAIDRHSQRPKRRIPDFWKSPGGMRATGLFM